MLGRTSNEVAGIVVQIQDILAIEVIPDQLILTQTPFKPKGLQKMPTIRAFGFDSGARWILPESIFRSTSGSEILFSRDRKSPICQLCWICLRPASVLQPGKHHSRKVRSHGETT